jgi:multicomponent Na+:H+ antiporter subunit D
MNFYQLPFPITIVFVPLLVCFLIPVFGWWKRTVCYPMVVTAVSISFISSLGIATRVLQQGPVQYFMGGWQPPWGIEFYIDHLNAVMAVLVTFISLLVVIFSKKSVEKELPEKELPFYCLFLLLFTGLIGIVVTGDMFNLYVFLEIASLSTYALIATGEGRAAYSAFKYVILGTVGACFYLLGVGYLYMATGSLNMADLAGILPSLYGSKVVITAFIFIMVGVAIKMALFPLHIWLPDAYTYAPSAVSSFVAPLMTKVGAYVFIRILFKVFKPEFFMGVLHATDIMLWFGIFAILFGGIMALSQTDFKKMLCYIIVAEIGYIIGGIGVANPTAVKGAIFHILNDAVMATCLFMVAGMIMYKTKGHGISDFKAAFVKMPYTTVIFIAGALAVIGVPPTCGFFSKWYLLLGGIEAGQWAFVAALLICTLITIALFFKVIDQGLYIHAFKDASEQMETHQEIRSDDAPLMMLIPGFIIAAAIFLIGIFNQPILRGIIEFAVPKGLGG